MTQIILDIFSGKRSQLRPLAGYGNVINVDLDVEEGICASALWLPFVANSIDEIIVNNPYIPYPKGNRAILEAQRRRMFEEAIRVLKSKGWFIINASRANNYGSISDHQVLNTLGFDMVMERKPLSDQFRRLTFRRTDASVIDNDEMATSVYEKR